MKPEKRSSFKHILNKYEMNSIFFNERSFPYLVNLPFKCIKMHNILYDILIHKRVFTS